MKYVKGYVCTVAEVILDWPVEHLFGPNSDPKVSLSEKFTGNGLRPFSNFSEAGIARLELQKDYPDVQVGLARIELVIAQSQDESREHFRDKDNLIVVLTKDMCHCLVGRHTEFMVPDGGLPDYPQRGLELYRNGYRPFLTFEEAEFVCWDRMRQAGYCPAALATLALERL